MRKIDAKMLVSSVMQEGRRRLSWLGSVSEGFVNCIRQILKLHFSDLASCISQILRNMFI